MEGEGEVVRWEEEVEGDEKKNKIEEEGKKREEEKEEGGGTKVLEMSVYFYRSGLPVCSRGGVPGRAPGPCLGV